MSTICLSKKLPVVEIKSRRTSIGHGHCRRIGGAGGPAYEEGIALSTGQVFITKLSGEFSVC